MSVFLRNTSVESHASLSEDIEPRHSVAVTSSHISGEFRFGL